MPLPEDEAGTSGPYLWVALPKDFLNAVPLNATSLFLEWVALLDPVAEVRQIADHLLVKTTMLDWFVTDRFVRPTAVTMAYLRAAAADAEIIEAFGRSTGRLRFPHHDRANENLRALMTDESTLGNRAMPVLLGLAVVATVRADLGYKSHEVRLKREKEREEMLSAVEEEVTIEPLGFPHPQSEGNGEGGGGSRTTDA
jgi:hypothetical protein